MASWIAEVIGTWGVWGVALLMFLENVFPPIPSELIMTLSGFAASRGEAGIVGVILAGTLGSLAGATFWYGVGRVFDAERLKGIADHHGRWLTVTRDDLDKADAWFDRHGHWAVLFGRLIPTVRTLISIPAGFSGMPLTRFLVYSALGTTVWTTFLGLFGYWLGSDYEMLERWLDPLSLGVVVLIVGIYIWRLVTFNASRRGRER